MRLLLDENLSESIAGRVHDARLESPPPPVNGYFRDARPAPPHGVRATRNPVS